MSRNNKAFCVLIISFAMGLCHLQSYWCGEYLKYFPFLPLAPLFCAICIKIRAENILDGMICSTCCCSYYSVITYIIFKFMFLELIPYHWCLLANYSLFVHVYLLKFNTETLSESLFFKLWLFVFLNFPFVMSSHIVSYYGGCLSAPLISIIDDDICVGSLLCNSAQVNKIYAHPYNIRAIINLCQESVGCISEYNKYNIQYIQLSTLHTIPPSIEAVRKAIEFIEKFIEWRDTKNNGSGRINIHCQGGRDRSVTVAFCWLLSRGISANEAIGRLKTKRNIISKRIVHYKTCQYFINNYGKS
eukprot:314930_1